MPKPPEQTVVLILNKKNLLESHPLSNQIINPHTHSYNNYKNPQKIENNKYITIHLSNNRVLYKIKSA